MVINIGYGLSAYHWVYHIGQFFELGLNSLEGQFYVPVNHMRHLVYVEFSFESLNIFEDPEK